MTEGTKSYLFGCHQFLIHPLCVLVAWFKVHKRPPRFWELCCIFLHDIGHIGKQYLSSADAKRAHWILGANMAGMLFGFKGFAFVAGHTKSSGWPRSDLFLPDKVSWLVAPRLWMEASRIFEPQLKAATVDEFKRGVAENIAHGCLKGNHDIYLEYSARKAS